MLNTWFTALKELQTVEVDEIEVSNAILAVLEALNRLGSVKHAVLMETIGIKHRPTFKKNYLSPAIELGLVEMSNPEKPRSPKQLYRLTALGRNSLA
ncbi:hypothetical protein MD535_23835 [Vibrio sp. ZSDZ65]|uniref:Filamentation induced by cAMP protein Fic-like C-terminal domain-containing protein n=1 Tax=Vibrio qingdaonensis TaxID=2829491 RepID=A0A9X3HYX7_9VIBR|nr:hypothetical protein [Vibrio qingdaonensis]MCW8349026.1 hypothetical protein [Vibrio qingdaonensis]